MRASASLVILPFLVGSAVIPFAEGPPATGSFEVYHYASLVEGPGFREVFLVHDVKALDAPTRSVEIRVNDQPRPVTWQDEDGALSVDDRFWFVQEAFDEKQVLTAQYAGLQVMECRFGGGAGLSVTPHEWRELGLEDQVRCLQLTDDQ